METFKSTVKSEPAVRGENTAGGVGLSGVSEKGRGVEGYSTDGVGVKGISVNYRGIEGHSTNEHGILGKSTKGVGVAGISENNRGVQGRSTNEHGVFGTSTNGAGIVGVSENGAGVTGKSKSDRAGVVGTSEKGPGVWGISEAHEGVHAETKSTKTAAMAAYQMNPASSQPAFFAKHAGNRRAARFEGDIEVTGKLTVDVDIFLSNADCAEDFDIAAVDDAVEPGTVMVVGEDGLLHQSQQGYDKRVAGVISGAGDFKPGIVLDKQESQSNRKPIALLGKVYCKVDATHEPIEVGDLLTTSPSPGHAMKANDPFKAFGAVIGKALRPLKSGQGLIPILIALQ